MTTSLTVDANGDTVAITTEPRKYTVSYTRKVGLPNYSNEELFISAQVPVEDDASLDEIERAIKEEVAFIKTFAFQQLGLVYGQDEDTGVVRSLEEAAAVTTTAPKKSYPKRAPQGNRRAAAPAGDVDKDALWDALAEELLSSSAVGSRESAFYDNRPDKESGKYKDTSPDFKHKATSAALWLHSKHGDAPDFVFEALANEVF